MRVCESPRITLERTFECPMDADSHNRCSSGICYIDYGTAVRKEDMLETAQGAGTDDVPYVCRFTPCLQLETGRAEQGIRGSKKSPIHI